MTAPANAELTAIFERQADTVYRVCYMFMRGRRADAEDAVQTTFLQLIRSRKEFESERHERAWLIVTASNVCKNSLNTAWRRHVMPAGDRPLSPLRDAPPDETLESVLALPSKYKTAIYMFYYEGYSAREIAEFMGKSESTVWSYLTRGRRALKNALTEDEQ